MKRLQTSTRWLVAFAALTVPPLLPSAALATSQYWRITTDRVTVITNYGARRCTKVANQFLAFERVVRDLANFDQDYKLTPLTVYVLSAQDAQRVFLSEEDRKHQVQKDVQIGSKILPGRELNIAAVVDGEDVDQSIQGVLLLYAQTLLGGGPMRFQPPWYQLGVANLFNGLAIHDDGSVLLARSGQFEPDTKNGTRTRFNLETLLAAKGNDLGQGSDFKTYFVRVRDFAQMGLLTTPKRRAAYRDLAEQMRLGSPPIDAVPLSFGAPLAELSREFDEAKWRREAVFSIPAPQSPPPLPAAEQLDEAQANELLRVVALRVAGQR